MIGIARFGKTGEAQSTLLLGMSMSLLCLKIMPKCTERNAERNIRSDFVYSVLNKEIKNENRSRGMSFVLPRTVSVLNFPF